MGKDNPDTTPSEDPYEPVEVEIGGIPVENIGTIPESDTEDERG